MSTQPDHPSSNHTTPDCDELRELLPAYVIGATTPEEAQQVERLLPLCPDVADDLGLYAVLTEGMSARIEAVEPPAHIRQALLKRVAASASPQAVQAPAPLSLPQATPRRYAGWAAAAAVFVLLLGSNAFWVLHVNSIETDLAALQQENQTVLRVLNAERLQRIVLQSTYNSEMLARVFWNAETRNGTFYTDRFPSLDPEHTYQVWLIRGDTPISMGTFSVTPSGEAILTFAPGETLESFAAIAISVEPAGGSPAPTTSPMAVGEIATSEQL